MSEADHFCSCASAVGVLRAWLVLTVDGMEGSHEFLLIDDFSGRHGQWVKTNSFTTIDDGKLFAPGNLRGTQVSCRLINSRQYQSLLFVCWNPNPNPNR